MSASPFTWRQPNSPPTVLTTWTTSFKLDRWRSYDTPTMQVLTWVQYQINRKYNRPRAYGWSSWGFIPNFSRVAAHLNRKMGKDEPTYLKKLALYELIALLTMQQTDLPAGIVPFAFNRYKHSACRGLWSPSWLHFSTRTASRTRKAALAIARDHLTSQNAHRRHNIGNVMRWAGWKYCFGHIWRAPDSKS